MRKSDTHLLQLKEIRDFIRTLDRAIPAAGTEITLIGGAAVSLLCADDERQTDDWESRRRQVFPFSRGAHHLRVFVPCPEDLAVMKVFRFLSKDQDDLFRLAQSPDFDRNRLLESFLSVLKFSVGDKRRDALSFAQAWNALFSSEPPLDIDEVMRRAGLA